MSPFKIIWEAMKTFYFELFKMLLMGALTFLGVILIIPAPFVIAGLWLIAQHAVEGRGTPWSNYWEGLKRYGPRNVLNTLLVLLGYVLIGTNLWFYNTPDVTFLPPEAAPWVTALWFAVTMLWTGTAFYLLAFQLELIEPKVWTAVRSSFFLVAARPLHTLVFLAASAAAIALSILIPPLLPLLPAFIAVLSVTAVKSLLKPLIERHQSESDVAPD